MEVVRTPETSVYLEDTKRRYIQDGYVFRQMLVGCLTDYHFKITIRMEVMEKQNTRLQSNVYILHTFHRNTLTYILSTVIFLSTH
jgi:hypothetical protein